MARKKGSKNKPKEGKTASEPYLMTPDVEAAIENAVTEMPKPPKIKDKEYPLNWDKMTKSERLRWFTERKQ